MFNIASHIINQGVPEETILLILMLPVVATFISFFRQVVGLSGFGIFTPLVTTFAFWATGLKYGLITFLLVLGISIAGRLLVKKLRLLYLPRMAILLTLMAIGILTLFAVVGWLPHNGFLKVSIFPLLMLVALGENFVRAQIEKSLREAIILSVETLVISVICFFLISWGWLQSLLLGQPAWLLLTILINIILGRWTGLRLFEYIRFRETIKHVAVDKKE